jgi:hypothetical protein
VKNLVIPGHPDVVRPQVDPIEVALVEGVALPNRSWMSLYLARWLSSQSTCAMGRVLSGVDPLTANLRATETVRSCTVCPKTIPPPWSDGRQQLSISARTIAGEAFAAKNCVISDIFDGREPIHVITEVSGVR